MYEINPKYLHADGTVDVERAMEAGRQARARAAGEGWGWLRGAVRRASRALVAYFAPPPTDRMIERGR